MRDGGKDGSFSVVGLGIAACVACCAGPILAFLGGVTVLGVASTWFIGGAGLVIAAAAATAFLVVRSRRRESACAVDGVEPIPIELTTREGAAR
jgi:hypothetical protein